jgi:hypothetical protein
MQDFESADRFWVIDVLVSGAPTLAELWTDKEAWRQCDNKEVPAASGEWGGDVRKHMPSWASLPCLAYWSITWHPSAWILMRVSARLSSSLSSRLSSRLPDFQQSQHLMVRQADGLACGVMSGPEAFILLLLQGKCCSAA